MVEAMPPDSDKTYSELFRAATAAQDVANYHDTIAGRDVGRIGKNFARPDVDPQTGEKGKQASSRLQRTLDWLLLRDANYARAHGAAMGALVDAENSVADGLIEIMQTLAEERRALEDLEDRAARLPDGTLVFRDANGEVVDADNNPIPDELAAGIEWRGDEPTYDDYRAQRDRIEGLEQAERELRGIETELGDIRGELTDQQEPPTEDRVGELADRVSELGEQADSILSQAIMAHTAPEQNDLSAESKGIMVTEIPDAAIPTINLGSRL